MGDLRERLVAAKIAGIKVEYGFSYVFRSNEQAADAALAVVADWLRDEAAELEADMKAYADEYGLREKWDIGQQIRALENRARALTHPDTTVTP